MGRVCDRCEGDIKLSYLLKQNSLENIICPNCGRTLKVTRESKIVTLASYFSTLSVFISLPIGLSYKIIISGIWTLLSNYLLEPLLYTYKEALESNDS